MHPNAPTLIGAALVGGFGWTLAEYLLHRFLMHSLRGRGFASREHLTHHARREYFVTMGQKALFAAVVTAIMIPVAVWRLGLPHALALQGGFIATYLLYEWVHRRAHTHPPRGRYGRWLRLHHFHHHFGRPLENHGVTTPLWDVVFGTRVVPPRPIRVPRRLAMRWLLTPDGALEPAFAADYVLVGRGPAGAAAVVTPASDAADLEAAFANTPPAE